MAEVIMVRREDFMSDISRLKGYKYGDQIVGITDAIYDDQNHQEVTL